MGKSSMSEGLLNESDNGGGDMEIINDFDEPPKSDGLSSAEVESLRAQYGFNELRDSGKKWYHRLLAEFWGDHWYPKPIPAMMWIAIIVSAAATDWPDLGVILFLHCFNSFMGFYESSKAGNAIAALKNALAPECNAKRDGSWVKIKSRELVPGDLIILKIGDIVPADCRLCEGGTCDLDQSGLTGESLPVLKKPGDKAFSGTVVKRGEQDAVVTEIGEECEMGKGAALINSVNNKGQIEVVMERITLVLVIFTLVLNAALVIVEVVYNDVLDLCPNVTNQATLRDNTMCTLPADEAKHILSNLIVLVVATIPIATPVVVTATMAVGARRMAQQKAVVSKLSAIEEVAGMTVLCSDKTGTLTLNQLTIDKPYCVEATNAEELLFASALAAKAVDPDAIDKCIRETVQNKEALKQYEELDFLPFDPVIKRTEATLRGPDGTVFKTSKGAPQVILKLAHNTEEIEEEVDAAVHEFASRGLRPLGVAQTDAEGRWVFLGLISLFDPPRHDTKETIERAQALGSSVKMITGDHLLIAKETCRRLGMGTNMFSSKELKQSEERLMELIESSDGFAEVFPEDKFDIVALFQKKGHITGMTGDGVNDAPALRKANVGFAVDGATAAAQGAADVVLTNPGLSVIVTAIVRSRKIFQRLQNYLLYRINVSVQLLTSFFILILVWHINFPTVVIIVMAVLFDLAVLTIGYDFVRPSNLPDRWRLLVIILISVAMALTGVAGVVVTIALIYNNRANLGTLQQGHSNVNNMTVPDTFQVRYYDINFPEKTPGFTSLGTWRYNYRGGYLDVANVYDQAVINTCVLLLLSLVNQMAVFTARTKRFFFQRRPGYLLLGTMLAQMALSTLVCAFWPAVPLTGVPGITSDYFLLTGLSGKYIGVLWLASIIIFLCQELVKMAIWFIVDKQDRTVKDAGRRGTIAAIQKKNAEVAASTALAEQKRRSTVTYRRMSAVRASVADRQSAERRASRHSLSVSV
mmetsp:Transcript_37714/g.97298  ORF Transcript_37714/g.97298 Transcript_37714/m.97298 type:complete len:982 (-) Transcript_37714:2113-5058(-)|eukprot:CAMPEP_0113900132 /NCGR_PEP_ID=MMETSP0780_2-20120614/20483_1 /TAXON_ID=652834 /ORGANISM="Palpitomonas bilix" /LENGTH=981 /DNA_ID=CAMNT_0000892509 /DNA_START=45 /DNA_END=2990 /DNA_ORIENTATION=- /assembly_acc=CAM_ASM_000599